MSDETSGPEVEFTPDPKLTEIVSQAPSTAGQQGSTPSVDAKKGSGPVRRSMIWVGETGLEMGQVPNRTLKFGEWMVLFGGEEAAQEYIDFWKNKAHEWGPPYKDQSESAPDPVREE